MASSAEHGIGGCLRTEVELQPLAVLRFLHIDQGWESPRQCRHAPTEILLLDGSSRRIGNARLLIRPRCCNQVSPLSYTFRETGLSFGHRDRL